MNDIEEKIPINNNTLKKYQMWSHKIGRREDVINTCHMREQKTNKILNFITEEEKNGDNQNFFTNENSTKKEENRRGSLSILPERVSNNINETRRLNMELKRQVDEITKMNAVYVMKQSGVTASTNTNSKDIQLPIIETNRSNNNQLNNFRYISETYRKQLMRAFLNFNPIIHLNNLRNLLEKADPEIKKDINNLWNNIEKDLKEVLDPSFHRKKYEKLITNKIDTRIENKMDNKFQLHTQINTNNKQFEGRINYPHRKTNKFNKEKTECKFKLILLKVDSYKECLHYIMHSLNNDNIEEYINDVKNSSNLPLEKQFNKYFYSIKLAEDIIINYQSKHLNKNTNKEIRTTQDKVSEHHKKMLEYIRQTKTELIKKLVDSNNKETRNKKSI